MKNWKYAPAHPEVAHYVDCYWFLAREPDDEGSAFPKLNPDPAAHLILAEPSLHYHYAQGERWVSGRGSHWLFPHCHTFEMDHSRSFQILGIKFHPGALYSLNLEPVQPSLEQIVVAKLANILSRGRSAETELLPLADSDAAACCTLLDAQLLDWVRSSHEDRHSKLVRRVLPVLSDTVVSELGARLHCSQRTLERSFQRVTGLTLKQYQSMVRLELMLLWLYQHAENSVDWADVAQRFGFSDQPHLIRYFRDRIGATPGRYARQRDLTIDVYGDFE